MAKALEIDEKVKYECIRTLYMNAKPPLISVVWVSFVVVIILWETASHNTLIVWFVLVIISSLIRVRLTRSFFKQQNVSKEHMKLWADRFVFGSLASGLLWASLVWFMIDFSSVFNTLAIMLTLVAMVAGALGPHAVYPPAYYAFLFPVVGSLIIRQIYEGGFFIFIALLMVGFLITFIGYARTHYRLFMSSIRQRFENMDLIQDLEVQKNTANKANADKTRFLASASHDLRQPMHAMNLYVEGLEYELTTDSQHVLLDKVKHSMSAMGGLLNSLLDMSKLDAGLVHVKIEVFNVSALLHNLSEEFQEQTEEKGIHLVIENDEACFVKSDVVILENILRNLFSNAIKYTDRGSIKVSFKEEDNSCLLCIQDTGIGIAREHIDKIFQAFYQVGNSERDRSQGIGLGLSIVARLCALLHHKCDIQSELGKGTQFCLTLPVVEEPKEVQKIKSEDIGCATLQATILIIDDDEVILDAMQTILKPWGCEVVMALSIEALEDVLSSTVHVDLIIADYRLRGGKTGIQAIMHARKLLHEPDLPSVVISGDTEPTRMQEVKDAGFMMLHKPVRPAQVRSLIQRLVLHG